jgi:hypothetical protein
MGPGADARIDIHAMFSAELHKSAQIALTAPVELPFNLFVMDPDHVSSNDFDAGGLHLENFFFPLRFEHSRIVKLTHNRQPRLVIQQEVLRVHGQPVAVGRG